MTWQTTLQKQGDLNTAASAVDRSYALLRRKVQNPLTLSPLGMALAACGGGGESEKQVTHITPTVTNALVPNEYFGTTDLNKIVINANEAIRLPLILDYSRELEYPPEDEYPPQACALAIVEPYKTAVINQDDGYFYFFPGSNDGCFEYPPPSISYKGYEIIEVINTPHENYAIMELLKTNTFFNYENIPLIIRSPLAEGYILHGHLSFLLNDNAIYVMQLNPHTILKISDELDQLILAGPVHANIIFSEGDHTLVFETATALTTSPNLEIKGLGSDDTVVIAEHLLGEIPAELIASDVPRTTTVSDFLSASQVIIDEEAIILSADLSEKVGADATGVIAFASDTEKMYFDADGDFTDGVVELIEFTDGMPSVEVLATSYVV